MVCWQTPPGQGPVGQHPWALCRDPRTRSCTHIWTTREDNSSSSIPHLISEIKQNSVSNQIEVKLDPGAAGCTLRAHLYYKDIL